MIFVRNQGEIKFEILIWLELPDQYRRVEKACQRLARPNAAREIAALLVEWVGLPAKA